MTELEPARLLDERATPEALRDALKALRERAPSDATAARIREHLHSPPARVRGSRGAAGSVVVIGLLGLLAWSVWPSAEIEAPSRLEAPRSVPGSPRSAAPSPQAAPRPQAPVAPQAAAPIEREPEAAPGGDAPARAPAPVVVPEPPRAERRAKPAPRAALAPPAREPAALPEPAAQRPGPEPVVTEDEPLPKPATVDDTERVFADPQDEAGLLYRAKRLSSSEPNTALRLLVLHEASFPAGAFAEERDMLEIQIHERLGHAATVKRLAAIFKQRYPKSVYRVSP